MRTGRDLAWSPSLLMSFRSSYRSWPIHDLVTLVFNRFGGLLRPLQDPVELERFLRRAASVHARTVVEIGTARGGTLFLLSCVAEPDARIVSIDLPAGPFGGGYPPWKGLIYRHLADARQSLRLIRGDSHKPETFRRAAEALEGREVDLLFIDGDHSYEGAKTDFLKYRSLVRPGGLVVFHDILDSRYDPSVNVAPLWRELAGQYEVEEIVASPDAGVFGIGVMRAPQTWAEPLPA